MTKKPKSIDNFINDQLSRWELARDNYRALKQVETRTLEVNGLDISLQFNPARELSTKAKVDTDTIAARPCFLCRKNRPAQQLRLKFEGRKYKRYDVLVNPYPIFPTHLVLASERHTDQVIWKRYVDMLEMTRRWKKKLIFYNGAQSGASAPDHFHFQMIANDQLPLVNLINNSIEQASTKLNYLNSILDADIFHFDSYTSGVFLIRSKTIKSASKLFYKLLDSNLIGNIEPKFNLLSFFKDGEFRSIIIFRDVHRPHHYSQGLLISPGTIDMAGVFILTRKDDFNKINTQIIQEVLHECSMKKEDEKILVDRLRRDQLKLSVGIMSSESIEFEIVADGIGARKAYFSEGKILYYGSLYDELFFDSKTPSTMFHETSFILHGVTLGKKFHWERTESQSFAGGLKIIVDGDKLVAINIIGIEDYLLSVISSEMRSTAHPEFLKAHAVISRSWLMNIIEKRKLAAHKQVLNELQLAHTQVFNEAQDTLNCSEAINEHIKWYDHQDHKLFDVCADDHCQRYQGLSRAEGLEIRRVIDQTWGQVLKYNGQICDARFSKCCGGVMEKFSTCWEDKDFNYLQALSDDADNLPMNFTDEQKAAQWIVNPSSTSFCATTNENILSKVLNNYDRDTKDFYRWSLSYSQEEISELVFRKTGLDLGKILSIEPLKRGYSGRIEKLLITGDRNEVVIGKELEIRRILSESHLKSSAFIVEFNSEDSRFYFKGAGWGHGVGLCQIGAAVMAEQGWNYRAILSHYYPNSEI